jgi:hypothetical protein
MRWFTSGFVFGALLFPAIEYFELGGELLWAAAPGFWLWVFYANPAIWLVCDVLGRDDLCIGLAFDNGPLEWLEYAWLYLSLGLMYGLLALALSRLRSAFLLLRWASLRARR